MARTYSIIIASVAIILSLTTLASAQSSKSYEFIPAPDVWYNDVDGIRLGIRLKGQVPGTFEDGPHRLNAGLWLGTWFPDLPVSYYLSFTEPIPKWSDFGSEANIQLISSIRTGYTQQGISFNKRWQQGFDERRYRELNLLNTYEKRFDHEYAAFPLLWSDEDKFLSSLTVNLQDENGLGFYTLSVNASVQYLNQNYAFSSLTAVQRIPFNDNWGFRFRGFAGSSTDQTAPEYLFARSTGQAIQTLSSGVTRAKGTIPQPWIEGGNFHVAGGANLRGYTSQDVASFTGDSCTDCTQEELSNLQPKLYNSIAAVNTEFDYPNPIKTIFSRIPYVADFITLRSYLFFDAGTVPESGNSANSWIADGGAGFALSLNIPDYLGKPRGFVIRYDIPFWLSDPESGDPFEYRSLIGFGAVLSF